MNKFTLFSASLLLLGLSACADMPTVQTTVIDTPTIDANLPRATDLSNVTWHVYDSGDLKVVSDNKDVVLFTLTKEEYEKLNNNIIEMRRYILQLKQTVVFYHNHKKH